jgi:hypothetical protein
MMTEFLLANGADVNEHGWVQLPFYAGSVSPLFLLQLCQRELSPKDPERLARVKNLILAKSSRRFLDCEFEGSNLF